LTEKKEKKRKERRREEKKREKEGKKREEKRKEETKRDAMKRHTHACAYACARTDLQRVEGVPSDAGLRAEALFDVSNVHV
jgi:hypothetical protein